MSCAETKHVHGKSITLIDTYSFFDTCGTETLLKTEIMRCVTECAPGPHVFLIVLKVEKYTVQEQHVIEQICQYFSEDALKHAAVVFTHGDQLPDKMKIEEFVRQNKALTDLVKKCGGRCHVVDNKYWRDNGGDNYRNNDLQLTNLLRTIEKIVKVNNGNYYTNDMLKAVKREIQSEEENIAQSSGTVMSREQIRNEAKKSVFDMLAIKVAGITAGVLLKAFLGVAELLFSNLLAQTPTSAEAVKAAAQSLAVDGLRIGYNAADGAETPTEAMQKAAEEVWNQSSLSSGLRVRPKQKQLEK